MSAAYIRRRQRKDQNIFLQILKNKNLLIIIGAVFALLLLIKFRSYIVFLVVVAIAAVINYFIHATNIHLHLGHVSFLAVIFSYTLGWQYGIVMIIVAHVMAEILSGHVDMEMMITGSIYVLNVFIAYFLNSVNIVVLGIGLTIFQAISTTSLGLMTGAPIHELITEDGVEFFMLIIYYLAFAKTLIGVVG